MKDLVRESVLGRIVNTLSNGNLLPYADQKSGYVVPERYRLQTAPISRTATIAGDYIPPPTEQNSSSNNTSRPPTSESTTATTNTSVRTLGAEINATDASEDEKEYRVQTEKGDLEKGNDLCKKSRENSVIANLQPDIEAKKSVALVDWDGPDDPDNPR